MQIKIGVPNCPLDYDYKVWGPLATDSWVKSLWEKIDDFNINVELNYTVIKPPRSHDRPIMQLMVDDGIRGSKL